MCGDLSAVTHTHTHTHIRVCVFVLRNRAVRENTYCLPLNKTVGCMYSFNSYTQAHIHTHVYIYIYMHPLKHTHVYIYIYVYVRVCEKGLHFLRDYITNAVHQYA